MQKKNIEKREKTKTKNEKKSNNDNKYIFPFTLLYRKIYSMLENIWKNLALGYIDTFVLKFFHLAGYWNCSKILVHAISNRIYLLRKCFHTMCMSQRYVHNLERNWKNFVCIGVKNIANL